MLRHQPFFDVLADTTETSPLWAPTLAGLTVLRLVDAARIDGSVVDSDWTGVRAVMNGIASLRDGSAFRRTLTKVMDGLRDPSSTWSQINPQIFAYGRALDLEGHWNLAADVFGTVAEIAREEKEPELAMEATTALGGAARRTGDWDRSAEGYAEAAHLADALGDKASGLTVRVGTANTELARGNLPAAQMILDEVIAEASKSGLDGVEALALHSSATVAHLKGQFADAVSLGYKALTKTTSPSVKDMLMADIAASMVELGMRDAARDAHVVIAATSALQWVRWQSTINLMELAAQDGMEAAFDEYAGQLKHAALDPRLRSYFLLYYGQGCFVFRRDEEGMKQLAEAQQFAAQNKINQVVFEAEKALSTSGERESKRVETKTKWTDPIPLEVQHVAEELSRLRAVAVSSSPNEWK